jgi:hypothetical protein
MTRHRTRRVGAMVHGQEGVARGPNGERGNPRQCVLRGVVLTPPRRHEDKPIAAGSFPIRFCNLREF